MPARLDLVEKFNRMFPDAFEPKAAERTAMINLNDNRYLPAHLRTDGNKPAPDPLAMRAAMLERNANAWRGRAASGAPPRGNATAGDNLRLDAPSLDLSAPDPVAARKAMLERNANAWRKSA
jgi:hypothetical protein